MLIIINDDPTYVSWISRHRHGFVVDCKRKPTKGHLTLHRASCSVIKPRKRARLTTGTHIKACSPDATELAAWAFEATGGSLTACPECQPDREEHTDVEHQGTHALTRLGREVLSYVLELTVMYLDGAETNFHPSVQRIAENVGKSAAQISAAIDRLIEDDYLECKRPSDKIHLSATTIIYPTVKAIRTIPAFAALPEENVVTELGQLRSGG